MKRYSLKSHKPARHSYVECFLDMQELLQNKRLISLNTFAKGTREICINNLPCGESLFNRTDKLQLFFTKQMVWRNVPVTAS